MELQTTRHDNARVEVIDRHGVGFPVDGSLSAADSGDGAHEVRVRIDGGRAVLIPRSLLTPSSPTTMLLPMSWDELLGSHAGQRSTSTYEESLVIPLVEETVQVEKRVHERGRVRISQRVREEHVHVEEPLVSERVEVERVPVGRYVEVAPEPRYEGDTLVLPCVEEVLVVERRLRLREEVRVRRVQQRETFVQDIPVRKTEVEVTRSAASDSDGTTARDGRTS